MSVKFYTEQHTFTETNFSSKAPYSLKIENIFLIEKQKYNV